jgi:hypothetical protein
MPRGLLHGAALVSFPERSKSNNAVLSLYSDRSPVFLKPAPRIHKYGSFRAQTIQLLHRHKKAAAFNARWGPLASSAFALKSTPVFRNISYFSYNPPPFCWACKFPPGRNAKALL